jgi:DNA-binding winged helix-turn-helix (wHTH) protein
MAEKPPDFTFDDVRVEPRAFKVWKGGSEVPLEPKAFSVLLFLIENRGRLVEKTELLDGVWKGTFVTENAMTREIARLRKALGDDPKEARYIQTVHTRGYRFIAEVTEVFAEGEKAVEAKGTPVAQLKSTTGGAAARTESLLTDEARDAKPRAYRPFAYALVAALQRQPESRTAH